MNKRITTTFMAVAAVFAVAAPTASATHGGNHASLHREFDVNIPLPVSPLNVPIANVCVTDEKGETNCTPESLNVPLNGGLLASYRVIVDVLAKTAAAPTASDPEDCYEGDPAGGKKMTVSALGTGIENAHIAIWDRNNPTAQSPMFARDTGQILGRRVTLDISVCGDPNG